MSVEDDEITQASNYESPKSLLKVFEEENSSMGILQSFTRECEKEAKINENNEVLNVKSTNENWHYSKKLDDSQRSYSDHLLTYKVNNAVKPKKIEKQITFGSKKFNKVSFKN